ncbi:MAG TPA: FAD-dependent oxidoreductase, partial [Steroidobacteraceae bacterium]|nr:FAD-dependent oxidoreductase [Steroidobacteraceae bacterium]
MDKEAPKLNGPDLRLGVELATIADGAMLLGHADGEAVLLARRGREVFALGAICTHYGAPLEQGLLEGETLRCPWHHACFSLRSGEALRGPALDAVSRWRVEMARQTAGEKSTAMVYVREKQEPASRPAATVGAPDSVVIVGGGAAGNAAAEMLRREGYRGSITMLSADESVPCDRPNLSKGYLSGAAAEASNPLRPAKFYQDQKIDLRLGARVAKIDTAAREVRLADGSRFGFAALLLATGAEPIHLDLPGAALPHVRYLRTLADSRALVARAQNSKSAVVIGASFIGLEVAASLRARGIAVQVVGMETVLMEKVLGPEVGGFLRQLHEEHGVIFHLGTTATAIDAQSVTLKNGERLPADLVVIGIGVRPALELAQQAGLAIDRGVSVNEYLETNVPGIFAAGDIAR